MSETDGVGVGVGVEVVDVVDLLEVGEDVEVVVCTEEVEAVVELVELEDECVRGVPDVVVEEGPDDGKMTVGTSPARLVSIAPRFPGFCGAAEIVVPCFAALEVEPGGTKPPRTPLRPCLLLRKRRWKRRYGSITRC
jgi:hypothetical protein